MAQNTKYGWRIRTAEKPEFFETREQALEFRNQKKAEGVEVEMPKRRPLPAKMYKISHK